MGVVQEMPHTPNTRGLGAADLAAEAQAIVPIVQAVHVLWRTGAVSDADLVGAYILAACAWRRPRAWLVGRLKPRPIAAAEGSEAPPSMPLTTVPALLELCGGTTFIEKKLGPGGETTLFRIFNEGVLGGLKGNKDNYINCCMASWFAGLRPCRLLFHVPSPMEVLRQQAAGERVVTLFLTLDELSRRHTAQLVYMEGGHSHTRDPLEFTLHDLKHMEHFVNPHTHLEQVGFFGSMLSLGAPDGTGGPRAFFRAVCGLDQKLWHELEYVISDMNTYSPHLMSYMLAKLLFATKRKLGVARDTPAGVRLVDGTGGGGVASDGGAEAHGVCAQGEREQTRTELETIWRSLLSQFGMREDCAAWRAACGMLTALFRERAPLGDQEAEALRCWFRVRAKPRSEML